MIPTETDSLKSPSEYGANNNFLSIFAAVVETAPETARGGIAAAPIFDFIKSIKKEGADCEQLADSFLKLYGPSTELVCEAKQLQKLLPNIPIKGTSKLLSLYGIEPSIPGEHKSTRYMFRPHKYVLSTMINSVNYKNFTERIKFAFRVFDEDDDGEITKDELTKSLKLFGKESQFSIEDKYVDYIVGAIFNEIDKSSDQKIQLNELESFFENSKIKSEIKVSQFDRERARTVMIANQDQDQEKQTLQVE